jgi:C4-dicarboxylate-specific signal transduction histidine kinase
VVPLKDAAHLWILYLAFGLLVGCVALVLFSYQYSIHGNLRVANYWGLRGDHYTLTAQKEETEELKKRRQEAKSDLERLRLEIEKHTATVAFLNRLSGGLFFTGALALVLFVVLNISREAHMFSPARSCPIGAADQKPQPPPPPARPRPTPPEPMEPIHPRSIPKPPKL